MFRYAILSWFHLLWAGPWILRIGVCELCEHFFVTYPKICEWFTGINCGNSPRFSKTKLFLMIGYPFDFQCDLLHQIFSVLWETLDRCSKVWIEFEFVSDIKKEATVHFYGSWFCNTSMSQGDPTHQFCVFWETLNRFLRYESEVEFLSYVIALACILNMQVTWKELPVATLRGFLITYTFCSWFLNTSICKVTSPTNLSVLERHWWMDQM